MKNSISIVRLCRWFALEGGRSDLVRNPSRTARHFGYDNRKYVKMVVTCTSLGFMYMSRPGKRQWYAGPIKSKAYFFHSNRLACLKLCQRPSARNTFE